MIQYLTAMIFNLAVERVEKWAALERMIVRYFASTVCRLIWSENCHWSGGF